VGSKSGRAHGDAGSSGSFQPICAAPWRVVKINVVLD